MTVLACGVWHAHTSAGRGGWDYPSAGQGLPRTPAPAAAAAGLTALVGPMDDSWARRVAPSGGEPAPADGAAQGLLQFGQGPVPVPVPAHGRVGLLRLRMG